jgi:pyruvate dehydrogenase E2 component (dihydrolipoamide acetyltransferase)
MVTKVIMPKLAANVEEATIGQWFKREGEPVSKDDPLFEAITDKAAVEVKAEGAGLLRRIHAKENSVVPVGTVIAVIADADEELPRVDAPPKRGAQAAPTKSVKASFGARRLAKELGVAIASVAPSRADGRITEADVRRAAARAGGPPVRERIPLTPLKRALAEHLSRTARSVAASFMTLEADCSALQAALPAVRGRTGVDVQPRDVLAWLAAQLLPEHPLLNACFTEEGILAYEPVNLALAFDVDRDDSVMVPVIRDAQNKSLADIAQEAARLCERLEAHALGPDDLADATFTITDQSKLGIDGFVPILNDKQSAILAMSRVRQAPVVRDGRIEVAPVTNLAVAFDHRVLNGTSAARFLRALRDRLEAFEAD